MTRRALPGGGSALRNRAGPALAARSTKGAGSQAGKTRWPIKHRKNRVAREIRAISVASQKRSRPDDHLFYQI